MAGKNTQSADSRETGKAARAKGRARAEDSLREVVAEYRAVLEAIPEMVFRFGKDGTVLDFVPAREETPALQPSEFLGRRIEEVMPAEFAELVIGAVSSALETSEVQNYNFRLPVPMPDGEIQRYEARLVRVGKDEVVALVTNVTERRRAEEALKESERRYRELFEESGDGLALYVDSKIEMANPRLAEMAGCDVEDLVGTSGFEFLLPEEHGRVNDRLRELAEGATELRSEYRMLRKDGLVTIVELLTRRVEYQGKPAFLSTVRDVSERKRAEVALKESEERYRRLSEVSSEGIVLHEDGRIIDANSAFAAMVGYERSEVLGMHALDLTAPESHDVVLQRIRTRADEPGEVVCLRKDGTTFPVEVRGQETAMGGRTVRVVAFRDLTDLKNAEARLQQARDELEGKIERQMIRRNPYGLSFREFTVLNIVARGRADKEIARDLGISPLTVQKHVASILAKMGASSRTEAGVRAVREGLVE